MPGLTVQSPSPPTGWLTCERTRESLATLDDAIASHVAEGGLLDSVALETLALGGKRVRPALTLLAGELSRDPDRPVDAQRDSKLIRVAAAIELLHVASLLHDDVIDSASTRRGRPTAHVRWGNGMATLAGTYLSARAHSALSNLGDAANLVVSHFVHEACVGQLQDIENAYNPELDPDTYVEILLKKTSTLFELPCRLGALVGGADADTGRSLATYGRCLGVAFQIADDGLDLFGDPEEVGKATGTDLRRGVYTLPVVLALRSPGDGAGRLSELLAHLNPTDEDIDEALDIVRASGTHVYALNLAREWVESARHAIEGLPDGLARQSLFRLSQYAIVRAS